MDRGTIYIPELVNKRLEDFTQEEFAELFDTTDVRNRSLMPQPPARLVENLRLDGVSVNLGDEVWLRSAEANIKLGGSLNVTRARDERETRRSALGRGTREEPVYRLALSGALSADRGTYTLDLGLVQREFQVQSGRITFFGTRRLQPEHRRQRAVSREAVAARGHRREGAHRRAVLSAAVARAVERRLRSSRRPTSCRTS